MFEITRKSLQWGGRELTIETGKIARQADGAVIVTYGETQVLATAVGVQENGGTNDFFHSQFIILKNFIQLVKYQEVI